MDRDSTGLSKNRTISGAIKGLFKSAAQALLRSGDAPEPKPRRKSGETEKGFGLAATAMLRRAAGIPAAFYDAATDYLSDALEMMRLYGSDEMDDSGLDDDYDTQQTHEFPQP